MFESVLFVSWTLSRGFAPVIASRPHDTEHVRLWARRGLLVACAVYLPYGVVFALRGDDLVALLFGADYVDHGVLLGLAAAPLLFGIMHLAASVLLALRPDPVVLWASIVALVVNVGTNLWLIPVWGLAAAAFATSFAFLMQAIVLMVALTRITGNIVSVRAMTVVVAATTCAGVVAELVGPTLPALAVSAVVFLAALAVGGRWAEPAGYAELTQALRRRTARAVVAAPRPTPGSPRA
ncbi:MAG: polysaccharide biosynthesis C-terminal domain-containing protein [Solirubrobacteraceae bacterium]